MDNKIIVSIAFILYLLILFGIAYYAEYKLSRGKSIIRRPIVYVLSLAIYCTAWTFYGSVGRACTNGMEFFAIYLGPTIACALFIPFMKKMVRISKTQRTNTIADFISNRYGKDYILAYAVAIFCIIGIIPYIALQIKAISQSLAIISGSHGEINNAFSLNDDSFLLCIVLILFIILFGTRSIDASEKHEGLVAAVTFESIIKLLAFLIAGIYIVYGINDGFTDLFLKAESNKEVIKMFTFGNHTSYTSWFGLLIISGLAFLFLPRQFQIAVVENTDETHLQKASWMYPLYMVAINLFVLPIAIAGLILIGNNVSADTYVLALPLANGNFPIGLLVFIGGVSAASGMIIVETIALCIMMSNNIIMPILLKIKHRMTNEYNFNRTILAIRRLSIVLIIGLAYLFDKLVVHNLPLVSIGLISFTAVSQFAPSVIIGLYWKGASRNGALAGIMTGFAIWFYILILPELIHAGIGSDLFLQQGPWGIYWLSPYQFFGIQNMDVLSLCIFWSLLLNTFTLIFVSIFSKQSVQEIYQAEIYVNIFHYDQMIESQNIWKNNAYLTDVKNLLENFIEKNKVNKLIRSYANRHKIDINKKIVDSRIITFAENLLAGILGSATARNLVSTFAIEKEVSGEDAIRILKESEHVIDLNKELRKKSIELERAKNSLQKLNEKLQNIDSLKDEFLYTVTHEIRTPITSVKAMTELIQDNPDMEEKMREKFLSNIIKETERLSHLINQVLTLEKYDSGAYKLNLASELLNDILDQAIDTILPLAKERNVSIKNQIPDAQYLLSCDRGLVLQVLINVLSNAIKFSNQEAGEVIIRVSNSDQDITVCISDNGRGIDPELKELIFDKFFQAKNQTLRKPEGSGLGLAICKKIIDLHHGNIWIESEPNQGAKFYFTLPINPQYE